MPNSLTVIIYYNLFVHRFHFQLDYSIAMHIHEEDVIKIMLNNYILTIMKVKALMAFMCIYNIHLV